MSERAIPIRGLSLPVKVKGNEVKENRREVYLLQGGMLVAMGIQVKTKLWGLGPGKVVK